MLLLAVVVGFRRDRSDHTAVASTAMLLTAFLVLLTPHYPWYYLALAPFVGIYPKSTTLWLLTVGGLHTYQPIPGEILPDFYLRQVAFHSAVLVAIAIDATRLWLARSGGSRSRTSVSKISPSPDLQASGTRTL